VKSMWGGAATLMPLPPAAVERLHRDLGLKRLNRTWAKAEIVLGLVGVAAGLLAAFETYAAPRAERTAAGPAAFVALTVLGGYLALAGHRSHLYQSAD
jgi:hypothetical protein